MPRRLLRHDDNFPFLSIRGARLSLFGFTNEASWESRRQGTRCVTVDLSQSERDANR